MRRPANGLEGIVPSRGCALCTGDRGLWVKVKCQNREEFVVVGWTDRQALAKLARSYDVGRARFQA